MARFLLVDGHSVIFAWPELRRMHARRTLLAREALVGLLTHYQDYSGVRVVAVFDGKGARLGDASEPGGIQVFYSATGQTADDVIERLAARYAREHDLTVATDDSLEQQTVSAFGGSWVTTEGLRGLLADEKIDIAQRLR